VNNKAGLRLTQDL